MLTAAGAALTEAATDGADPTTWLQVGGSVGLIGLLIGLLVWLLRLILRSGGDARAENTRLDKQIAAQDKQLDQLRKEIDAERKLRFAAENDRQACRLELQRLQQIVTRMGKQRASDDDS